MYNGDHHPMSSSKLFPYQPPRPNEVVMTRRTTTTIVDLDDTTTTDDVVSALTYPTQLPDPHEPLAGTAPASSVAKAAAPSVTTSNEAAAEESVAAPPPPVPPAPPRRRRDDDDAIYAGRSWSLFYTPAQTRQIDEQQLHAPSNGSWMVPTATAVPVFDTAAVTSHRRRPRRPREKQATSPSQQHQRLPNNEHRHQSKTTMTTCHSLAILVAILVIVLGASVAIVCGTRHCGGDRSSSSAATASSSSSSATSLDAHDNNSTNLWSIETLWSWLLGLISLLFGGGGDGSGGDGGGEGGGETPVDLPIGPRWRDVAPPSFLIGGVLHGYGSYFDEYAYREVIAGKEFNSITTTAYFGFNAWDANDPNRFAGFDAVVEWATARQLPIHAHVLLYPLTTRDRFTNDMTDAEVTARIRQYVTDFATRHAGKIYVWDAANEVIGDENDLVDNRGLRTHFNGDPNQPIRDYQAFGGSTMVEEVFRIARAIDPTALLILNDYGVELRGIKSDRYLAYALYLRDVAGVPIDGLGFQMHWIGDVSFVPSTSALVDNMQRFADAGFRVFLTEVDVSATQSGMFPTLPEQQRQRTVFQNVLQACLEVTTCEAYWLWDFADDTSWVGPEAYATPFWNQLGGLANAKPAYYGIQDTLVNYQGSYLVESWWGAGSYLGRVGQQDANGIWVPQEAALLLPYSTPGFDHLRIVFERNANGTFRLRSRWEVAFPAYLTRAGSDNTISFQPLAASSPNQQWHLEQVQYPYAQLGFGVPAELRVDTFRLRSGASLYLTRTGEQDAAGVWQPLDTVSLHDGMNPSWLSQLWTLQRGK